MTGAADTLLASARARFVRPFEGTLRVEAEGAPAILVDGRGDAVTVAVAADGDMGDLVWRGSGETLRRILDGARPLEAAYLSGRLVISGDMSVMGRLALESAS